MTVNRWIEKGKQMPRVFIVTASFLALGVPAHSELAPATPQPTPMSVHHRVRALSIPRLQKDSVVLSARTSAQSYASRNPVLIRFELTNATDRKVALIDRGGPSLASLTLVDGSRNPVKAGSMRLEPVLRVPVLEINAGETVITPWFAISDWGFALSPGRYTLTIRPHLQGANVVLPSVGEIVDSNTTSQVLRFKIMP